MRVRIEETTDNKYVGMEIEMQQTDLELTLPSCEIMQITGRCHIGNGLWRFWNSNYIIKVQEII